MRVRGEQEFPLGVANVVVQRHRRRLGGERLVVVYDIERVRVVGEMALRSGDCADAVANPFERLGGELELVHPVDRELEARDPHPGGHV